jgi:hypothetical protein
LVSKKVAAPLCYKLVKTPMVRHGYGWKITKTIGFSIQLYQVRLGYGTLRPGGHPG